MMKSSVTFFRSLSTVVVAALGLLGSRSASAQNWVMGGWQSSIGSELYPSGAGGNSYFTGMIAEFYVPPPPRQYSSFFSIWPGLQGYINSSNSYVIQPVLEYGPNPQDGGNVEWYMVIEQDPSGDRRYQTTVQPNDLIETEIYLDESNMGTRCNPAVSGNNCNYVVTWKDLTNTNLTASWEYNVPVSPTWSGFVFETQANYNSCYNFPFSSTPIEAILELYVYNGMEFYTPIYPSLVRGYPGSGEQFTDQIIYNGTPNFYAYADCNWYVQTGVYSTPVSEVLFDMPNGF